MSPLQKSLNDYLALRRSLGFKLKREGLWLPTFVRAIGQSKSSFVTSKIALKWAQGTKNQPPKSWAKRLRMVRKFAQYVHARDPRHEVPPLELAPIARSMRFEPYIYSDDEVRDLMNKAKKICQIPFKGETYSTMIGVLAATGMRVGEVITLDRSDFDRRQGLLQIRKAKFGKSRQIPLHPTTIKALCEYEKIRDRELSRPRGPAFFLSSKGKRLIYNNFQFVFHKLVISIGLGRAKPQPPRVHDLRHTFAVKTITSWYKAGLDTGPRLPALSTYLGHVCPSSTYTYLHATPELLQQASRRLEKSQKGVQS